MFVTSNETKGFNDMTSLDTNATQVVVAARALKAFAKSFPDEMAIWIKQSDTDMGFIIQSILSDPKEEVTGAMIKRKWVNDEGIFINSIFND